MSFLLVGKGDGEKNISRVNWQVQRERENLHFMCFETPPPLTNISLLIVLIKQANPEAKQKVWL